MTSLRPFPNREGTGRLRPGVGSEPCAKRVKATNAVKSAIPEAAEIALEVPQSYRDYLMPRRLWCDWRLLSVHIFSLGAVWTAWTWTGHTKGMYSHLASCIIQTALYLFVAFLIWRGQGLHPWQYAIGERDIQIIAWGRQGRLWYWHTLVWDREVISHVEEGEWRGLPALSIHTAARKPAERRVYTMVFAHEDRERVSTQIVPLIQQYRERFRHEFWCEHFGT
jgi:hypothetical protein